MRYLHILVGIQYYRRIKRAERGAFNSLIGTIGGFNTHSVTAISRKRSKSRGTLDWITVTFSGVANAYYIHTSLLHTYIPSLKLFSPPFRAIRAFGAVRAPLKLRFTYPTALHLRYCSSTLGTYITYPKCRPLRVQPLPLHPLPLLLQARDRRPLLLIIRIRIHIHSSRSSNSIFTFSTHLD